MVTDRRIVSANEARRLQRHGSHMCAFPRVKKRKKWTKRLGGHACSDRALGRFRTYEEPRSIVQSRTIERGVLGTICGRRHGHRERPARGRIGRAVEGHAHGVRTGAKACRPSRAATQRASSRCPGQRAVARQVARFGRTASPETARRKTHWGWRCPRREESAPHLQRRLLARGSMVL